MKAAPDDRLKKNMDKENLTHHYAVDTGFNFTIMSIIRAKYFYMCNWYTEHDNFKHQNGISDWLIGI